MEYQQGISDLLEQCQHTWLALQEEGVKENQQVSQDLHDEIKQLVQLQDALDDGGFESLQIETLLEQVRSTLQKAAPQARTALEAKASPVSSKSSPLQSTRLPSKQSALLPIPKAAASISENTNDQLIYPQSVAVKDRIIPGICVNGVAKDLEELTLDRGSSSAGSSSEISSFWQTHPTTPTGPTSLTATSSERPFGRRSLTAEEFPKMQKDTEKRSKLSFPPWKKPKASRSAPLPHDAPARINFLHDNAEEQNDMFASDAIVDHPLRIGVGYGSYICYNCTLLSNKGTSITVRKRYSDFVDLRDMIIRHYPTLKSSIPKLPPKKVVGKFTPSFVEQRRRDLEYFFKYVVLHPTLGASTIVKHWIAGTAT